MTGIKQERDTASDGSTDLPNQEPSTSDEALLSGLSADVLESERLAQAFWETAWPKLEQGGWEKRLVPLSSDVAPGSTVLVTSKHLDFATCEEGTDYFHRLVDVIKLLNQRRNVVESTAADQYRRAISRLEFKRQRPANWLTPHGSPNKISKEGSHHFSKKKIDIGEDFQASLIPKAGSFCETGSPSSNLFCDLVFDPNEAQRKGIFLKDGNDVIATVAHNVREQALMELAKLDYNVDSFHSTAVPNLRPMNGSDWSQGQKEKFHHDIFRLRRDIRAVAKGMDISVQTCLAYYLGTYKSTCDYRLLKTVCIDERNSKEAAVDHGPDACAICGDGGSLLICDGGCDLEFHMSCLRPPLRVVPEGDWLCDDCVDRRVVEARDYLIRHSKFFEPTDSADRACGAKHSLDDSEVSYKPTSAFLDAAREFSIKISKVLSRSEDD